MSSGFRRTDTAPSRRASVWTEPSPITVIRITGTFHCARAAVPAMTAAGYGRIVAIASVAGKEGNPNARTLERTIEAAPQLLEQLGAIVGLDHAVAVRPEGLADERP